MTSESKANILSDIIVFQKYAKYIPSLKRRETWKEISERYCQMMINKYPYLESEIRANEKFILEKKALPSMRALQFAGVAIEKNHSRGYNCAYLPISHHSAFSEVMFLLLGGTGVGYSVQRHHVSQLPPIIKPQKSRKFLIGDSIEGWADAIKALMKSYFGTTSYKPRFDFSDIRPKGAQLITAGGKAPGPEPLKVCLMLIEVILDRKKDGELLTPLEAHDILCHIADSVLAGGIRRAALISLFSIDDEDMLSCKSGAWYELNEQRGRANNSVILERDTITEEEFLKIWNRVELSKAGEPGIYWTNDKELGANPCNEISLRPYQFCNLTEANVSNVKSQEDLNERIKVAAFFGTLQAGFTDFHYLRAAWKRTTDEDALIGVGMTGIGSGVILQYDLKKAATVCKEENERVAELIGINKAARCNTTKPSGTTSLVLGTSSGIHAWHSEYYIRRMRLGKNEALYKYLIKRIPQLLEDDVFKASIQSILTIPQKAPDGAILRDESALHLLQRVKKFNIEWVREGHRSGLNTNNVSATISVKEHEWERVGKWMWDNKDTYNGLSVLPYDNGSYTQAPFEECTKEEFERLLQYLNTIDLTQVIEEEDITDQKAEAACANGACEIV